VEKENLLTPILNVRLVDRDSLKANDYNPNKVLEENMQLLERSIMTNGWTMPIVVRADMTIIDGYHRWTLAGREPLRTMLGGKVPVVVVDHDTREKDIYGTITHNRARGTHLLDPMKAIVQELLKSGKTVKEIAKELGMRDEEVFRLSGITRDDFLRIMAGESYSEAVLRVKA
jgi:ParB-like chromosome segregation protein Spo0J